MLSTLSPANVNELGIMPDPFIFEQLPVAAHSGFNKTPTTARTILDILDDGFGTEEPYVQSKFGAYAVTGLVKAIGDHAPSFRGSRIAELKNLAVRGGLGVLALGRHPAFRDLKRLTAGETWLDEPLTFEIDCYTAPACRPDMSQKCAERLLDKVGTQPQLMIPLCNGGLVSGMQVALGCGRSGARDIALYPLRFSRDESKEYKDKVPAATDAEREILKEYAKDRVVVVHDEDANFGGTIAGAVALFKELCPENQVIGIAADDARGPWARNQFGEWWELA